MAGGTLLVLLAAGGTPVGAQPPASSESQAAETVPPPAPAVPPASLARIRRALALGGREKAPIGALDFSEDVLLRDERPKAELWPNLGIVAGVDQFSRSRPPVPGALPGHWDMVAAMTPREVTQVGSTDVMGIATAAAFSAAVFTVVPSAVKAIRGWFLGGDNGTIPTHPLLTPNETSLALTGVTNSHDVLDASIDQRGRTVALSLTVTAETPPGAARALGDDFVRLVKTIAATEPTPGDDLGPGDFDYVVRISTPTNALLARGGKSTSARAMNW